jgi:hypothetical protein
MDAKNAHPYRMLADSIAVQVAYVGKSCYVDLAAGVGGAAQAGIIPSDRSLLARSS